MVTPAKIMDAKHFPPDNLRHTVDFEFSLPTVCPTCRASTLRRDAANTCLWCTTCTTEFSFSDGFPNLAVGARFEDTSDDDCQCYEDLSNSYSTENYWIPLFRRLFSDLNYRPRILDVGCGTGAEVDMLHAAGFDAVGIEIGNRTRRWPQRTARAWLMLANGMHMPFPDGLFDAAFCGCVFPHVGVIGDSNIVSVRFREDRLALAQEMARVVRPGGQIFASSPNRLFPLDIFHGRAPGSYKPRLNLPTNRFLLSVADYRSLLQAAGCEHAVAEPVARYWGFLRSRHSIKGRVLGAVARSLFWLTSLSMLPSLRGSILAPWIVVRARRAGHPQRPQ